MRYTLCENVISKIQISFYRTKATTKRVHDRVLIAICRGIICQPVKQFDTTLAPLFSFEFDLSYIVSETPSCDPFVVVCSLFLRD